MRAPSRKASRRAAEREEDEDEEEEEEEDEEEVEEEEEEEQEEEQEEEEDEDGMEYELGDAGDTCEPVGPTWQCERCTYIQSVENGDTCGMCGIGQRPSMALAAEARRERGGRR